jgi:protein required for attachment to host cells
LGKDEVLNFIDGINREFVVPEYKSFEVVAAPRQLGEVL